MVMIVIARQMCHGPLVAVAETFAIGIAIVMPHGRVPVLVMIVGVSVAMVFKIMSSCFDAVVKASPLRVVILLRGLIPIVILRHAGHGRTRHGCMGLDHRRARP